MVVSCAYRAGELADTVLVLPFKVVLPVEVLLSPVKILLSPVKVILPVKVALLIKLLLVVISDTIYL